MKSRSTKDSQKETSGLNDTNSIKQKIHYKQRIWQGPSDRYYFRLPVGKGYYDIIMAI